MICESKHHLADKACIQLIFSDPKVGESPRHFFKIVPISLTNITLCYDFKSESLIIVWKKESVYPEVLRRP